MEPLHPSPSWFVAVTVTACLACLTILAISIVFLCALFGICLFNVVPLFPSLPVVNAVVMGIVVSAATVVVHVVNFHPAFMMSA